MTLVVTPRACPAICILSAVKTLRKIAVTQQTLTTDGLLSDRFGQSDAKEVAMAQGDIDYVRTGADTLAGRYMRRFWHPVFRAQDLAAGQAKPSRILSEDFTLYRGESGAPHAVGFRCAHRGAQMSIGFIEGDCLRCFYHGWMYDQNGVCVDRPGERQANSKIRIRSYPTREYLGLIFVYFGDGEPPALPRFPRMEEEGVLDVTADKLPINYFYSMENDAFHFAFAHRDLLADKGLSGVPEVWAEESDWGMVTYDRWPNRNAVGIAHKGMPNVGYIVPAAVLLAKKQKHALHVSWRVPIDDDNHITLRATLTPVTGEEARKLLGSRSASYHDRASIGKIGDAILAGAMTLQDVKDRTHIEFIEDYIAQVGQGPITTRDHEILGKSDAAVALWRRIWRRELAALRDGQPLKQWQMTDKIDAPIGTI
jgi:5,5'-dehydrodivanillate O-demethylase oxygenase subunit